MDIAAATRSYRFLVLTNLVLTMLIIATMAQGTFIQETIGVKIPFILCLLASNIYYCYRLAAALGKRPIFWGLFCLIGSPFFLIPQLTLMRFASVVKAEVYKNTFKKHMILTFFISGIFIWSLNHFSEKMIFSLWNPEKAVIDAKNDIENKNIGIYISGTIKIGPVGVEENQLPLISNLQRRNAGTGCVMGGSKLRKQQKEYAILYNKEIVRHLQRQ